MFTPWNLYPARNVDTNGHIEIECFNLLKPVCRNTRDVNQEEQNMSHEQIGAR
jgi:hypothetical protein